MAHIDVRGPHPMYVDGMKAIVLVNYTRSISTEQGKFIAEMIVKKNDRPMPLKSKGGE